MPAKRKGRQSDFKQRHPYHPGRHAPQTETLDAEIIENNNRNYKRLPKDVYLLKPCKNVS